VSGAQKRVGRRRGSGVDNTCATGRSEPTGQAVPVRPEHDRSLVGPMDGLCLKRRRAPPQRSRRSEENQRHNRQRGDPAARVVRRDGTADRIGAPSRIGTHEIDALSTGRPPQSPVFRPTATRATLFETGIPGADAEDWSARRSDPAQSARVAVEERNGRG